MLLVSHLHHPDPLALSGIVLDLHEDMAVEAEHDEQGDHKNDQEDHSEVNFL